MKTAITYGVAVMLILLAVIGGILLHSGRKAELARKQMASLKVSLESYYGLEGQFPESLHSLADKKLVTDGELLDPWGAEFIYVPCYKDNGNGKKKTVSTYMLSSAGPDRKSWTKDDIQ